MGEGLFHTTIQPDTAHDITVRAHLEWVQAYDDATYALSDSGADSAILGRHAHVLYETGRYATLVGYNPSHTQTARVPIVTAYVKCKSSQDDICVFLKINEAPWIQNNPITLISEYQVRDHGFRIDSTSKHHPAYTPSGYGAQCLELSPLLHVPFQNRGAIMGFEILPINVDTDFTNSGEPCCDVFEITSPLQWKPSAHRGCSTANRPHFLNLPPNVVATARTPRLWTMSYMKMCMFTTL